MRQRVAIIELQRHMTPFGQEVGTAILRDERGRLVTLLGGRPASWTALLANAMPAIQEYERGHMERDLRLMPAPLWTDVEIVPVKRRGLCRFGKV